jgi:hypothetical protein
MGTKSEVIGWLLDDTEAAQVLVRDSVGDISLQTEDPDGGTAQWAIQTGRFRRANVIVDSISKEVLAWEPL